MNSKTSLYLLIFIFITGCGVKGPPLPESSALPSYQSKVAGDLMKSVSQDNFQDSSQDSVQDTVPSDSAPSDQTKEKK